MAELDGRGLGNWLSRDARLAHNCGQFNHASFHGSNGNSASFDDNGCFGGGTGATDTAKRGRRRGLGRRAACVGHIRPRLPLLTEVRRPLVHAQPHTEWSFGSSFQLHFQEDNRARCRILGDKAQNSPDGLDSRGSG